MGGLHVRVLTCGLSGLITPDNAPLNMLGIRCGGCQDGRGNPERVAVFALQHDGPSSGDGIPVELRLKIIWLLSVAYLGEMDLQQLAIARRAMRYDPIPIPVHI